ncbi:hypothetical protein R4I97_03325 [Brachyspira pilosicoli]|uniref:PTS sugar transporter subunit IIA n=1 Tax=Brachyspira pilosicoli TaxID=52584 RepID=UPI003004DD87
MFRFIMASHGNFASGIKESINMISGNFDCLESFCCYVDKNFDIHKSIDELLTKYKEDDVIVITDIYGGSVNNAFLEKLHQYPNLHLISGLNLSLMLALLLEKDNYSNIKSLITDSINDSKDSFKYCNEEFNKTLSDDEF